MIKKQLIFNFLLILFIFFLDRISKIYILSLAENLNKLDIKINSFLNIILVWNTGIGFWLFQFYASLIYNVITILIIIISVAIFGLLLFVFVKNYIKKKIDYYLIKKNKKLN